MEGEQGARQAINLDHERRLMALEREFWEHGRVTALENEVSRLSPEVNEVLLAKRVTEGVSAAIAGRASAGLNRWTKLGIGTSIVFGTVSSVALIVQLWPG